MKKETYLARIHHIEIEKGLKAGFAGSLRLEFHDPKVTSDAGLLAYRDLSVSKILVDRQTGRNAQHMIENLFNMGNVDQEEKRE